MKEYIRTDKNGTKYYLVDTCTRCGGSGFMPFRVDDGKCFKCGGSGRITPYEIKEYTPEYRAILDAKNDARKSKEEESRRAERIAEATARNIDFLNRNFFSSDTIKVYLGDTYAMRDELKAEGGRYKGAIGWYCKETTRPSVEIKVTDLIQANMYGEFSMKDADEVMAIVKGAVRNASPQSKHIGEVGQKLNLTLTVKFTAYFDSQWGRTYIHNMVDDQGNVFIWKTNKNDLWEGKTYSMVATVKEHGEYDDVAQTIITRPTKIVEK